MAALGGCADPIGQDDPPVTIEITSPADGAVVAERRVRIRGRAENAEQIEVNGTEVAVVGGVFDVALDFDDGPATAFAQLDGVTDVVEFTVDATSPALTLTSPERGAYLGPDATTVRVEGRVEEAGAGLDLVKIDERIVAVADDGTFGFDAPVEPGLNVITATAIDLAGNTSDVIVGVVQGETVDPTATISPGFGFLITPAAMESAAEVIAAVVTPEFVLDFVGTSLTDLPVTLTEVSFDPIQVTAIPRSPQAAGAPGAIDITLTVTNAELSGEFELSGGDPIGLDVSIARAVITTSLRITADGEGGLSLEVGASTLDLPEGSLTWSVKVGGGELSNEDSDLLEGIIEDVARGAFSELLSEQLFDQLYDPDLLKREVELFGRTLAFEITVRDVVTNASGVTVAADITLPADRFAGVREVPGALARPRGPRDAPEVSNDALVTTDRTALDRLVHGAWRAGLLHQSLEGANFAGLELPFELTAGALALLLDGRVANYASNTAPVQIALRPELPPILALEPAGDDRDATLGVRMGELHIDVLLEGDSGPQKLVTLGAFLELDVDVSVQGVEITLGFDASARVDVVDEPLFDLDDEAAEDLFEGLVALVPSVIADGLQLGGQADLLWLRITNPTLQVHGLEDDQVTLGLDIEANPDGLDTSE
jgi:hypothetical protein